MREYFNSILAGMKPKYHELVAYLTALTCAVLFVVNSEFRQIYFAIFLGLGAGGKASLAFIALGLLATAGLFLSFLHPFIKRKKSDIEKICIGTFIMGTNGLAGIVAGIEMLPSRWSILWIVPIWNILMGVLLLYQLGLSQFEISDENASLTQVFGASLSLFVVFAIVDLGLHLPWAIAFSICVFYSSTIFFIVSWIINYFRHRSLSKV